MNEYTLQCMRALYVPTVNNSLTYALLNQAEILNALWQFFLEWWFFLFLIAVRLKNVMFILILISGEWGLRYRCWRNVSCFYHLILKPILWEWRCCSLVIRTNCSSNGFVRLGCAISFKVLFFEGFLSCIKIIGRW